MAGKSGDKGGIEDMGFLACSALLLNQPDRSALRTGSQRNQRKPTAACCLHCLLMLAA